MSSASRDWFGARRFMVTGGSGFLGRFIVDGLRDRGAADVFVPRSRNVEPELLKESLYRLTDLESRFTLNLNVLDSTRTPGVLGLKLLLQEWIKSQIDILLRRTRHRLDKIAARLELVEGYIIASTGSSRSSVPRMSPSR